jgi:hypothetical protein
MDWNVFGRRRKTQALGAQTRAPEPTSGTIDKASQGDGLEEWRRSAQRVTRAWNSWLAADRHERRARYQAFVSALAEEEQAAASIELTIEPSDIAASTGPTVPDVATH